MKPNVTYYFPVSGRELFPTGRWKIINKNEKLSLYIEHEDGWVHEEHVSYTIEYPIQECSSGKE